MMRAFQLMVACVAVMGIGSVTAQAAIVHTADFINDGSRTNFMGFEALPETGTYGRLYEEGGFRIEQINGRYIWTTFFYPEGSRGWYPNGGDRGFTMISLLDGSDFNDVGMARNSGNLEHDKLFYDLYDDGSLVQSGSVPHQPNLPDYIGFSGGGFDTILLRDGRSGQATSLMDGTHNALALDAIEARSIAPVPEPVSLAVWSLLSIVGVAYGWWRKRRN